MSSRELNPDLRRRVREASHDRCGYCLSPQQYVMGKLEVEHIVPRSQGGSEDESNLWLSCSLCNRFKGIQVNAVDSVEGIVVALFNPRTQRWEEHFQWDTVGTTIRGLTPTGRATVEALRLNNEIAVEVRRNWVLAGWHPPKGE